jgi:hypothetical protein
MSQWGKLDRFEIPGTATANLGNYGVTFSQSQTGNVAIGYALVLANVEYVIANINTATTVTLDVPYETANLQGITGLAVQQQPKTLRTYGWGGQGAANLLNGANTVNARNVYGVDLIEAANPTNKRKGIKTQGWVHYQTWTNTLGQVRNRAEVLVAMSKNFNANATGTFQQDAYEDAIIQDYYLTFQQQPALSGLAANSAAGRVGAVYNVVANVDSRFNNPVITYKWQKSPNNIVWVDVINAPYAGNVGFTGNTTDTLTISNVYIGYPASTTQNTFLRCVITVNSSSGGALSNTSSNVQVIALSAQ